MVSLSRKLAEVQLGDRESFSKGAEPQIDTMMAAILGPVLEHDLEKRSADTLQQEIIKEMKWLVNGSYNEILESLASNLEKVYTEEQIQTILKLYE